MKNSIKELETTSKLLQAKAETLRQEANFLTHKGFVAKAQATWEAAQKIHNLSEELHIQYLVFKKLGLKELSPEIIERLKEFK